MWKLLVLAVAVNIIIITSCNESGSLGSTSKLAVTETTSTASKGSHGLSTSKPAITERTSTTSKGSHGLSTSKPAVNETTSTTSKGSHGLSTSKPAVNETTSTTSKGSHRSSTSKPAATERTSTTSKGSQGSSTNEPAVTEATTITCTDSDSENSSENNSVLDSECNGGVGRAKASMFSLAFKVLYNLILSRDIVNDTVIGSPVITWYIAAQSALYLRKERSVTKLLRFLGLRNKEEIRCVLLAMIRIPKDQPENTHYYYTSNMWAHETNKFTSRYKQDVAQFLEGKALNDNFNRPKTTTRNINRYTAKQINNTITKAVPSSSVINNRQSLVSVAASSFQARWMYAFDKNNITQGDYWETPSSMIKVPYVYQEADYNYTYNKDLGAKIVEIPYEGDGFFQCFIIRPDTACGLRSVAQKLLQKPELWTEVINGLELTHMKLYLPYYSYGISVVDNVDLLRETGQVQPILEDNPAQLKNVFKKTTAYLSSGVLSIKLNNILDGEKQTNIDGCSKTKRLKQVEFKGNVPSILIIQIEGVPVHVMIGKVQKSN